MQKPLNKFDIAFLKGEVDIFGQPNNSEQKAAQRKFIREDRMSTPPKSQAIRAALGLSANVKGKS